ncbi:MAG TPA: hypothetical protein VMI54_26510 [Polyangiaceae bacterium]|nr:hypothetical protein [Polyangiaceae bacterium]
MSRLELSGVSDGALRLAAGRFDPACTVVSGDDASALAALAAVMSGVAPARGQALLDGKPLSAWPPARRRVASVLAREALPPAESVGRAVTRVLAARGDERRANDVLEPFGLGAWSSKRSVALDHDELRSVALALALTHAAADLFVLYEPASSSLDRVLVRERIAAAVTRGAVVVLVSANTAVAESFGGPHAAVVGGVLQTSVVAA